MERDGGVEELRSAINWDMGFGEHFGVWGRPEGKRQGLRRYSGGPVGDRHGGSILFWRDSNLRESTIFELEHFYVSREVSTF